MFVLMKLPRLLLLDQKITVVTLVVKIIIHVMTVFVPILQIPSKVNIIYIPMFKDFLQYF